MMKDSLNRNIDYLRVSLTDRCNLRCIYCQPDRVDNEKMDLLSANEIEKLVSVGVALGVRKVRLTGGEPLTRPDILDITSRVSRFGVELTLTTNGLLLAPIALELKKSGLKRVNISLDTLEPEKYRAMTRGGDIEKVFESIEVAEHSGLTPIKINVVPIRGVNDDEIEDFARLTYEKNYHIRFIELMPNAHFKEDKKRIGKEELLNRLRNLGQLMLLPFKGRGPSRNYRFKGAKGVIGLISPISDCFCKYCNRLRITSRGTIRPCLFSDTEIDIKTPLRNNATTKELTALFLEAVRIKPEGHSIPNAQTLPSMSKIGG